MNQIMAMTIFPIMAHGHDQKHNLTMTIKVTMTKKITMYKIWLFGQPGTAIE